MNIKKFISNHIIAPLKSTYYVGILSEKHLDLPVKERYSKIRWIDVREQTKESWFADPFIYAVSETEITLFVEEYPYSQMKGKLSKIVVNLKDMTIKSKRTLLELPTHLSFPIFHIDNGKTYIYPENYQSGKLKIYEYNETDDSLTYIKDIIDEPLVDTQITKIDDTYYAFGILNNTDYHNDAKEVRIYKSDSSLGKYEHIQTIRNDKAEERGAGRIYIDESGRIIRPVQSCENDYGTHIILYQLELKEGQFIETKIKEIHPDFKAKYGKVFHTFNMMSGLIAVDGWNYDHPFIAKLYSKIKYQ